MPLPPVTLTIKGLRNTSGEVAVFIALPDAEGDGVKIADMVVLGFTADEIGESVKTVIADLAAAAMAAADPAASTPA